MRAGSLAFARDDRTDDSARAASYIDTPQGLVVITGCGHAGTINTVQHARSVVREAPAHGLIGGLHLFASGDQEVRWTATRLKEFGLAHLLGAHCTGIEAVYRLRDRRPQPEDGGGRCGGIQLQPGQRTRPTGPGALTICA
jgi:metal-dependent hydrolase (beta-lactamase superfamily II)